MAGSSYFAGDAAMKSDLFHLNDGTAGWAQPYGFDVMKSYVKQRLIDHLGKTLNPHLIASHTACFGDSRFQRKLKGLWRRCQGSQ